jgi:hypothetical protein
MNDIFIKSSNAILSKIVLLVNEKNENPGCAYCKSENIAINKAGIEENIIYLNIYCSDCNQDDEHHWAYENDNKGDVL